MGSIWNSKFLKYIFNEIDCDNDFYSEKKHIAPRSFFLILNGANTSIK